ncbi:helix-turn-helix domain-containing protein [Kitasatospora nipponensis]|uniref:Helix-turn-helix domain-containing protein n=1 Tax=Kitasatospora nipponensis TaxID=258049 RepID=A0ABN1WTH9_9ACTN
MPLPDHLLTIAEVAAILGTTERFPRRLVAERRIAFIKVGRHIRIAPTVLADFMASNTVQPVVARRAALRRAA